MVRIKNIVRIPDGIRIGTDVLEQENFFEEEKISVNINSCDGNECNAQQQGFSSGFLKKSGHTVAHAAKDTDFCYRASVTPVCMIELALPMFRAVKPETS